MVGLRGKQPITVLRAVVLRGRRGMRSREVRLTGCEGPRVRGVEVTDSARFRRRKRLEYILYSRERRTKIRRAGAAKKSA